ncbi:MAG: PD-(D/E)XK nuclease family transposase [Bacteroidia bacterium]
MSLLRKHVRFDWAAKNMLRDKKNFGILEGFLSELLKEDIKIEGILESESNQETESSKFNRVDAFAENSKGELIIIEVQNTREWDYLLRMLFATSKAITEHIEVGEGYANVKKVIAVSIVYFELGQGDDYIYVGQTRFRGMHTHSELQLTDEQKQFLGKVSVHEAYPEYYLIRTTKFQDVINDTLDEWIYFFQAQRSVGRVPYKGMDSAAEIGRDEHAQG